MKRIMAVYDVDPFYANKFAEFANEKEKTPFTAIAFTSLSRLKNFADKQAVELLLVGDEVLAENLEDIKVGQVIRLSESGMPQADGTPVVYKYQASDRVLREVMACYQVKEEPTFFSMKGEMSTVVGIYSPAGRCGKTGFAMTLGQVMAKNEKVLLLCLEDFSGFSRMTGTEYKGTLSDLLYYFRLGAYSRLKLGSVTYHWNGLDYVPPVTYAEDLRDVTGEELVQLLQVIAKDGGYDTILLDFGHFGKGAEALMELCCVIYTPVPEDSIGAAKVEEWKQYLEVSGRSNLKEKVELLSLPKLHSAVMTERYLEQILWGEMGDFVRELVRGKEKEWR
ncbi:MAG: hypothetical protein ACI39W_05965 [Brotaphodocola sp.]